MQRWLPPVALVFVIALTGGCGTVVNFGAPFLPAQPGNLLIKDNESWPRYFGGLQVDTELLSAIANSSPGDSSKGSKKKFFCFGFLLVDSVASLCADTATLPLVVVIDFLKHPEKYTNQIEKPSNPAVVEQGSAPPTASAPISPITRPNESALPPPIPLRVWPEPAETPLK